MGCTRWLTVRMRHYYIRIWTWEMGGSVHGKWHRIAALDGGHLDL